MQHDTNHKTIHGPLNEFIWLILFCGCGGVADSQDSAESCVVSFEPISVATAALVDPVKKGQKNSSLIDTPTLKAFSLTKFAGSGGGRLPLVMNRRPCL